MTVISIDPGDSTGVALWSDEGIFLEKFKMPLEEFLEWAAKIDFVVSKVIVEDYVQNPNRRLNAKGSKMKASQGLGAAKLLAVQHGAELVVQKNTNLNMAAMHTGTPIVKHFDDDTSAYLHGYWYFESVGLRRPALQERPKRT